MYINEAYARRGSGRTGDKVEPVPRRGTKGLVPKSMLES